MSRRLIIGLILAAVAVLVVVLATRDGDEDAYVVRAIFDSGGFMVKGELVRVAGADVGEIESVDVTRPGEISSYEDGRPQAVSGKAVIVMRINDPSFQDFRRDASCHIRPQSLIGEKFVDCRPTLPRAPGSPPPPPLREIPEGQPGEGQYLLPLENNSTSVDPDLINDINSLPYAQRFRLILNELGAGLAGRGEDIEEAVKRANPALRDAGRLIGILDEQREQLTQLAADSEEILGPFSREREHVAGFFANAGAAGEASSERGDELEESLRKFPEFLRQFRATMRSLGAFSDAASPVFADFDRASPAYTEATRLLTPFSAASTVALKSLGASGEVAGPLLRATDPGGPQDARPRSFRRRPDQRTVAVPDQHAADEGLRRVGRPDLQRRRHQQRLRPVRPLRSQPGHPDRLLRIHGDAGKPVHLELQLRRRSFELGQLRRPLPPLAGKAGKPGRERFGRHGSRPAAAAAPGADLACRPSGSGRARPR